jgi:hypothetical protein
MAWLRHIHRGNARSHRAPLSAVFVAREADPAIDAIRVGPVRLDRNNVELFLPDERARQVRANPVELVRAVRGLPDEHNTRVINQVKQRPYAVLSRLEPEGRMENSVCRGLVVHPTAWSHWRTPRETPNSLQRRCPPPRAWRTRLRGWVMARPLP